MNKQEFAFRLMTFFIPYPLSRILPRLLRRLFRGPSIETPGNWAAAAFDAILKLYDDTAAAAESLLAATEKMTPTDQLTDLIASLKNTLDTVSNFIDLLKDIIDNLDDYTPDNIIYSFDYVLSALDDLTGSIDDLAGYLPPVVIPAPPPYTPPVNPIFIGPPIPGPTGPTPRPVIRRWLKTVWFRDNFEILDPAIWTDLSEGGGVCSIVNEQLKMLSTGEADFARLTTDPDPTIPETFIWSFNLRVESGAGLFYLQCFTGVHNFLIIFDAPNILKFKLKDPADFIDIDVGNYMGINYTWKFLYNGTTCTIYRGRTLISSDLTILESANNKGIHALSCENGLTIYLDNYKFLYPL